MLSTSNEYQIVNSRMNLFIFYSTETNNTVYKMIDAVQSYFTFVNCFVICILLRYVFID